MSGGDPPTAKSQTSSSHEQIGVEQEPKRRRSRLLGDDFIGTENDFEGRETTHEKRGICPF